MPRLKVKKTADGELGVSCPRCDDVVVPLYVQIFDYYNCPECDQSLDPASLRAYKKALQQQQEDEEWGGSDGF